MQEKNTAAALKYDGRVLCLFMSVSNQNAYSLVMKGLVLYRVVTERLNTSRNVSKINEIKTKLLFF